MTPGKLLFLLRNMLTQPLQFTLCVHSNVFCLYIHQMPSFITTLFHAVLTHYPCCCGATGEEKTLDRVLTELLQIYHTSIKPVEELYNYKDLNRHIITGETTAW